MFNNNGPISAQAKLQSYIAYHGVEVFPTEGRSIFSTMVSMPVFQALTEGTEWLYAALLEGVSIPDRTTALEVLGELAQAAGISRLQGETERWWAIRDWAAGQLVPDENDPVMEPPVVKKSFSFLPPAQQELPVA